MRLPFFGPSTLGSEFQMVIVFGFLTFSWVPRAGEKNIDVVSVNLTTEGSKWAEKTLKDLSLEEKVGQMFQIRYYGDYANFEDPEYKLLRNELQKYNIGSVVFGMHFSHSGPVRSSPLDTARIANELQLVSKIPLLLAADLERGVASRLTNVPAFPWPMAFGALGDARKVQDFAGITAREARTVGIQWALAPVADVNSNPANPVINVRSFGEDPNQVGDFVTAFIRGAHDNGLLVTAKHFPGNGDISIDSHRKVATIESDLPHLQNIEFPPFKRAIETGVDSIMLAHARVPVLEPDPDKITTISSKVVKELLSDQFGFKGVVLTDALEMQGLTKLYDPQKGSPTARAAVDAVKAGCDVIMIPTDLDGAYHGIIDAVHRGEILESRIDDSVRKILRMKASVGLYESKFVDLNRVLALTSQAEDMDFAQHITDEAITLVRDSKLVLPLRSVSTLSAGSGTQGIGEGSKGSLVVLLLGEALTGTDGQEFGKAVKSRRPDATVFYFDNRTSDTVETEVLKAVAEAGQVVMAVYVLHNGIRHIVVNGKVLSSFGPLGPSAQLMERVLGLAGRRTAVVALGNPYLIVSYPEMQTYICTYAMTSTSEISAVKSLFGEIENHAKLPVTLPGVAPRGFSIPWPTAIPKPGVQAAKPSTLSSLM